MHTSSSGLNNNLSTLFYLEDYYWPHIYRFIAFSLGLLTKLGDHSKSLCRFCESRDGNVFLKFLY